VNVWSCSSGIVTVWGWEGVACGGVAGEVAATAAATVLTGFVRVSADMRYLIGERMKDEGRRMKRDE
jgi:hypothetical protein